MSSLIQDDCNIFHLTQKLITTRDVFLQVHKGTKQVDLYKSFSDLTTDNLFLYLNRDYNYDNMKGEIALDVVPSLKNGDLGVKSLVEEISHNLLHTTLVENSENLIPTTYSIVTNDKTILMFNGEVSIK